MSTTANLFMKIDGIEGCVTDKAYEGWIAISHANHGVYRAVNIGNGAQGLNTSGASFDSISFSKGLDKISTELLQLVTTGAVIEKIIIAKIAKVENKDREVVRWIYDGCFLSSHSISVQDGDDIPFETLSFSFGGMQFQTLGVKINPTTDKFEEVKYGPVGWDLIENKMK